MADLNNEEYVSLPFFRKPKFLKLLVSFPLALLCYAFITIFFNFAIHFFRDLSSMDCFPLLAISSISSRSNSISSSSKTSMEENSSPRSM